MISSMAARLYPMPVVPHKYGMAYLFSGSIELKSSIIIGSRLLKLGIAVLSNSR